MEITSLGTPMDGLYLGVTWYKGFAAAPFSSGPSIPRVTTETGWLGGPYQQGEAAVNLYLAAAARGRFRVYIYQMIEDGDSLGLFRISSRW